MISDILQDKSIALIIPDFDHGGEEKRVVFFANNYANYFKEVYVISPSGKSNSLLSKKVKHIEYPVRNYSRIPSILNLLKENKIDFLQGHKRATLPYLVVAEKLLKLRSNFNYDNIYLNNFFSKYLMPSTVFYLSDKMKEFYASALSNKENITINMGGEFYPMLTENRVLTIKESLGIHNQFVLLNLGRLSEQKNQGLLLEALNQIKGEDFICLFVGGGPKEKELIEKCKYYNLEDKVKFLGHRTDIADLLNISDLMVQSSIFEGFPNVFIEAASVGLPIVSTDVGSSETLIKDNGILVVPNSADDLAKAIQLVRGNYPYYKRNAVELGRSAFFRQFHKNNMLSNYLSYYKSIS